MQIDEQIYFRATKDWHDYAILWGAYRCVAISAEAMVATNWRIETRQKVQMGGIPGVFASRFAHLGKLDQ